MMIVRRGIVDGRPTLTARQVLDHFQGAFTSYEPTGDIHIMGSTKIKVDHSERNDELGIELYSENIVMGLPMVTSDRTSTPWH